MIPYKLEYTIEKSLQKKPFFNQDFTNDFYSKNFWNKIQDHKWYLSERLGRDVGMFVAALDYFLNIHKLPTTPKTAS